MSQSNTPKKGFKEETRLKKKKSVTLDLMDQFKVPPTVFERGEHSKKEREKGVVCK